VQAFGHIPLEFQSLGLDLMSVSAHKIGGPVGVGALVVRRGITPCPIGLGGGQEGRIRSGTLPVALAASFAAAATKAVAELAAESAQLTSLRDDIRGLALASGGRVNGKDCAPHIVSVTFPGLRAQDLLFLLDASGILGHIFGSQQAQAQNQIGQASGLSSGQAGQLLQMLAPIVMGFLAKQVGSAKLDAGGLGNLLGGLLGQGGQSQPQSGGLAGGLLSSALDQNGDGKLDAGDLLKLGSRLLGGKS